MINKLKTFATTMLVTGATVTATWAPAATVNTNTYTNVVQNLTISLTAYSNAPVKSATSMTGEKPVTITTKTVLGALSNASGLIPSLVGFNWGKSPQLVYRTTFASTNVVSNTVTALITNMVELSATNPPIIAFNTNTNSFPTGTQVTITDTNGTATLTNSSSGTNVVTASGSWTQSGSNVTGTAISLIGTNGLASTLSGIPTNANLWTVFTAATNASGTNLTAITYTNVPHTSTNYMTNYQGVEVQGGTAEAPTFADVTSYISEGSSADAIISATGTGFGTTNQQFTSKTTDRYAYFYIDMFNTTAGTAAGNNLNIYADGFMKAMSKLDVLHQVKGLTNEVGEETFTASVAGYGSIGGSYVTNSVGASNSVDVSSIATEYYGTNTSFTNVVTGSLTNPIPVVVQGTVSLGAPKSIAQ